jgi:hypothetical protein
VKELFEKHRVSIATDQFLPGAEGKDAAKTPAAEEPGKKGSGGKDDGKRAGSPAGGAQEKP